MLETTKDIGESLPDEQAIIRKAGYLLFNLVSLHPFLDGNKRTSFEVTENFLELDGWEFAPSEDDSSSTLKSISSGAMDAGSTEGWLARNLSRRGKRK